MKTYDRMYLVNRNESKRKMVYIVMVKNRVEPACRYYGTCGGCQLQHISNTYEAEYKQKICIDLLGEYGKIEKIKTMNNPYNYRNKIHSTFGYDDENNIIAGMYEENTHKVINIEECIIQDKIADDIIKTIKQIMRRYKMQPYNEDTKEGFLRHVLIRTGYNSKEVMVVLVTSESIFPGSRNFVKLLRKRHKEIVTVIQNINDKETSLVLGDYEKVLYGPGFILDTLCEKTFRISSKSFYQVNTKQAEILYQEAINMLDLKGNEKVIDAYCGIGTISIIVSEKVKEVIGVELNSDAVKDAIVNARNNNIDNTHFYEADAGEFMLELANNSEKVDVVIMDPPRSGSDETFLQSLVKLSPKKISYISCNPKTQKRDLKYLVKNGYNVKKIQPVDMFPQTTHVETVVLLEKE